MSGEKSKIKLDSLINGANWTAIFVVGFATIALISIVYKRINMEPSNTAPKEIIVKYEIVVDTIALKKVKDPTILKTVSNIDENNKKILEEINASVSSQYKRMESILEVQEDRSKIFSYGAGFLAILVAIATFFGFKSINEMKKGTIDTAEYEAQKIAEVKAKEVAEVKAKEVAEVKAKEVAEVKAKEVAEVKAKEVATETARQIATETAKEIAEKEAKSEVRERLNDIQTNLKNSLELEFKDRFDKHELSVSDEWENRLKNDFKENFERIIEDIESIKVQIQQIENLDKIKENALREEQNTDNEIVTPEPSDQIDNNPITENSSDDENAQSDEGNLYNDEDLNN